MSTKSRHYPDRPVVGVLAVVRRADQLLLVRRTSQPDRSKWGFPGGGQELGETVFEGAMRELMEETGVVAEPVEILTVIDVIARDGDGRVRFHYALVAVLADWVSGEGIAMSDAEEARWFTLDELDAMVEHCSPKVGEVARRALVAALKA